MSCAVLCCAVLCVALSVCLSVYLPVCLSCLSVCVCLCVCVQAGSLNASANVTGPDGSQQSFAVAASQCPLSSSSGVAAAHPTSTPSFAVASSSAAAAAAVASSTGAAAVFSDPRCVGFWGQSFYVGGVVGGVYSLLSDCDVQLSAQLVQLSNISCPYVPDINLGGARVVDNCFEHAGTYFGQMTIRIPGGRWLRIVGGAVSSGFAQVVTSDGHNVQVGALYDVPSTNATGSSRLQRLLVERPSARQLVVSAGVYVLLIDNMDRYVDLSSLQVTCWDCVALQLRPTGLLGQTWEPHRHHTQHRRRGGAVQGAERRPAGLQPRARQVLHGGMLIIKRNSLSTQRMAWHMVAWTAERGRQAFYFVRVEQAMEGVDSAAHSGLVRTDHDLSAGFPAYSRLLSTHCTYSRLPVRTAVAAL